MEFKSGDLVFYPAYSSRPVRILAYPGENGFRIYDLSKPFDKEDYLGWIPIDGKLTGLRRPVPAIFKADLATEEILTKLGFHVDLDFNDYWERVMLDMEGDVRSVLYTNVGDSTIECIDLQNLDMFVTYYRYIKE